MLNNIFSSPPFRLPSIIKSYGNQIKNAATVFRLRVYEILTLLQPKTYEGKHNLDHVLVL